MIDDFPVVWMAPEVKETLRILQTIWRQSDIERIVGQAGLPPGEVRWDPRPAITWRSVFELAAGQDAVGALLDEVTAEIPALKVRLDELRTATRPVVPDERRASPDPAMRDFDSPGWKNFSTDGRAEAIIVAGQPTFVDVSFLAVGLDRARSVCRLSTRFPGEGSGTGFRIGPEHVLTNHHVLFNRDDGDRKIVSAEAWFNYESDEWGQPKRITQVRCDPDSVVGEKADDWALIRTTEPIPADFPMLPVTGAEVPEVDDRVYIIQHPYGQPKKVAFQHNLVRSVEPDKIQYWTDTDLGSSGSPVFDESWRVVALHHFSVPAPEGDRVSVRNQGRRIDRIVERMRQLGVYPGAER